MKRRALILPTSVLASAMQAAAVEQRARETSIPGTITSDKSGQFKAQADLRADLGVTFGDANGTDTNLRSYWSNQSTGLVDDIPGEIMLTPSLWGEVRVK